MSKSGSLYIHKASPLHQLDGSIKFLLLITWTVFVFMFMDIRIFTAMIVLGFGLLKIAQIEYKSIRPLLLFVIVFTLFNSLFLILITPSYGSELAGTSHRLVDIFGSPLTTETLFFALTLSFKYIAILPVTFLFIFTTHPSKFASSLNRLGVSYKVAYAINIALRYIPDVQDEMQNIINAQEARGIPFKKGDAPFFTRFKNHITIVVPMLISSLNRIEVVSNAMELRGFGRHKTRSWYGREKFTQKDLMWFVFALGLIPVGIYLKHKGMNLFWYPFK